MRGVSLIRLSALFAALTLATPPSLAQGSMADMKHGRALESCAIQRENEVPVQLGLGRRTDHGIEGLAIANRWHH